jgi:Tol biopolymer transport system component
VIDVARCLARALLVCLSWSFTPTGCKPTGKAVRIFKGPVGELGPLCSPDGHWLAFEYFTARGVTDTEVWIMPTNGKPSQARALLNDKTYEYGEIAWSPDSAWISFIGTRSTDSGVLGEQIFKVDLVTKQAVQLTNFRQHTSLGAGTSWSKDGRIAFEMDGDIYVVPASGGVATKLVDVSNKLPHVVPYFPAWSPDGTRLAFVGRQPGKQDTKQDLFITNIATGESSRIFEDVADDGPSWFDEEHLLVSRHDAKLKSSIWLVPISTGPPLSLTHGFYDGTPSASPTKVYLYFSRCEDLSKLSLSSPAGGFHLWKLKLSWRVAQR